MNIKFRAALRTAAMFGSATLGSLLAVGLFQLEVETIFNIVLGLFFAWMVWVIYSINLNTLQNQEDLKLMLEKHSKPSTELMGTKE